MMYRTPLGDVRGLGSARAGTEHWWHQRVTAVANVPLVIFLLWLGFRISGGGYEAVASLLKHPVVAALLIVALSNLAWHMKLGMQVIIEDYVHSPGRKFILLIANIYFPLAVWAIGAWAVLKLSLGA